MLYLVIALINFHWSRAMTAKRETNIRVGKGDPFNRMREKLQRFHVEVIGARGPARFGAAERSVQFDHGRGKGAST